jgi:nitrogen fixation-related uncharacterized protein
MIIGVVPAGALAVAVIVGVFWWCSALRLRDDHR